MTSQNRPQPLCAVVASLPALALASMALALPMTSSAQAGTAVAPPTDNANGPATAATQTIQPSSTGLRPTHPLNNANRLPAAPDTADATKQAHNCYIPEDLRPEPGRLPGLSAALVRGQGELLVIILGSETTRPVIDHTADSALSRSIMDRTPLASRLQERLALDLGPLPGRAIRVEAIGRRNSTVNEQAALIGKQILPRKPALVVWNIGRADASRGLPPASMARALDRGLEQLHRQHIDTIVMDPPYHPQFEAFYRTDDYRQYIRWTMNLHEQPYLHRYDMIDYWASTGRIDLDAAQPERQAAAATFTETCVAYQLSRMIDQALSRK